MKIIASLTTMPNRIDLIRTTLDSLRKQTIPISHIEINIPYKCIRTDKEYIIPEWLEKYPNLQIYRTEDYGAITKVAPTLLRYKDNDEIYIWSVDDDINYPCKLLACLLRRHDKSIKRILSHYTLSIHSTGIPFHKVETDKYGMILEGGRTVLYPPFSIGNDFFSYLETTSAIPDCKVSDDIVLSNYFYGQKIPIFTCNGTEKDNVNIGNSCLPYYNDATATHLQSGGHTHRYIRVLYILKKLGLLYWTFDLPQQRNIIIKNEENQILQHILPIKNTYIIHSIEKPTKLINNFALSCSSAKAGKRFYG